MAGFSRNYAPFWNLLVVYSVLVTELFHMDSNEYLTYLKWPLLGVYAAGLVWFWQSRSTCFLIGQFVIVYGMTKLAPRYAKKSFTFSEIFTLATIFSVYV